MPQITIERLARGRRARETRGDVEGVHTPHHSCGESVSERRRAQEALKELRKALAWELRATGRGVPSEAFEKLDKVLSEAPLGQAPPASCIHVLRAESASRGQASKVDAAELDELLGALDGDEVPASLSLHAR